jgi:hypothetical protein
LGFKFNLYRYTADSPLHLDEAAALRVAERLKVGLSTS